MAVAPNDLHIIYSGGIANADPDLSLGGAISEDASKRVLSQQPATQPVSILGVVIDDAYGNAEGAGSLNMTYDAPNYTLSWKPFGQTTYYGVDVTVDGTYLIGSSSGYMVVTVTNIAQNGTPSQILEGITIANELDNIFDSVSALESLLGRVEYRCLYVLNNHATDTAIDVRIWIPTNTPGGDTIAISLATGDGPDIAAEGPLATELIEPADCTFVEPTTSGGGLTVGNLTFGQYHAFWIRRTVPVETRGTVIANGAVLAISTQI